MTTGRPDSIPVEVREFIFAHIDAVEHLEVLLFLRLHSDADWDAQRLSQELRTNPTSIAGRLASLEASRLLIRLEKTPITYQYHPATPHLGYVVDLLAEAYKVRRHRVFELIFSPMKKARPFARAFRFKGSGDDDV